MLAQGLLGQNSILVIVAVIVIVLVIIIGIACSNMAAASTTAL